MKKTSVTICILILLVLFMSSYIVYDKVLSIKNDNNFNNIENTVLPDWVNYLSQYDLTLTVSVWNNDRDECNFEKISISSSDVKKIISELSEKEITKNYYGSTPPTSTICSDRYRLEYNNSTVGLESDGVWWVNDQNLINKLDLDVDKKVGSTGNFVYQFNVDFAGLINKYVNQ